MSNSSRGKDGQAKQENETSGTKLPKKTASTTSSRQWAAFRNPRIVRVSRSFGGKDRHSKVCTIKGLRDRRIRLSVPSAIMLYDLQHKLGLGQPSKVVDWLLNETKHEIDKLPPLPFSPEEYFSQFNPKPLIPHDLNAPQSSLSPFFHANSEFNKDGGIPFNDRDGDHNPTFLGKSKYWTDHSDADSRVKSKGVEKENIIDHNKWYISRFTTNVQENQGNDVNGDYIPQFSAQNFFPLANQFSFPSLLSSNTSSYNWDPSNLSVSQFGNQPFSSQADLHSTSLQILPSLSPQCPPFVNSSIENDPRQSNNHFQLLCSTSQQHLVPNSLVAPFRFISPFNVNPKVTNSATNNDPTK